MTITLKALINMLQEKLDTYDSETEVEMDYGGVITDIEGIYDNGDTLYIG